MKDEDRRTLQTAIQLGFINPKQATQLADELDMFPGQNLPQMMMRRQIITPPQMVDLQTALANAAAEAAADAAPPPPQQAPRPPASGAGPGLPSSTGAPHTGTGSPYAGQRPGGGLAPASLGGGPTGGAPPRPAGPGAPPAPSGAPRPAPATAGPARKPIHPLPPLSKLADYLKMAREAGCSDLHLHVDRPPFVRLFGEIHYLDEPVLTPERSQQLNLGSLTPTQRPMAEEHQQLDFALTVPGVGRHRCNVFKSRVGWEGSYRIISDMVPTLDGLGLPPVLKTLTEYHQGLVLVTGPGGSGKTTTVAAMIDYINGHRSDHIITVEDPVEYIIPGRNCQVTQREVGRHTQSFGNALRAALRQDPDVIMVGEMRDLETTSIAISAAETGHLVFGTLHTGSAARTVARIMDVYPPNQRQQICTMVAESMRGVISQQLIPRRDGTGFAVALEVLVFTSGVGMAIKEGKSNQLVSHMQSGRKLGMVIMDDSLKQLAEQGIISGRSAYQRSENKAAFEAVKDRD